MRTAFRQVRLVARGSAPVRVCWDLDNTLVDSGALLRIGRSLDDAIVDAGPVPHMLDLYTAMRSALPYGEHVILTARLRSMRGATLAWLERHGVSVEATAVCFVPSVEAKPKVWAQLAHETSLVIVDDLTYNHEREQVSVHGELVSVAERVSRVYIGVEDIRRVAANPSAIATIVERTRHALAA